MNRYCPGSWGCSSKFASGHIQCYPIAVSLYTATIENNPIRDPFKQAFINVYAKKNLFAVPYALHHLSSTTISMLADFPMRPLCGVLLFASTLLSALSARAFLIKSLSTFIVLFFAFASADFTMSSNFLAVFV